MPSKVPLSFVLLQPKLSISKKETKTIKVTAFVNGQKFEHFQEVGILAKVSIENVKIEEDENGQISIVVENLSI